MRAFASTIAFGPFRTGIPAWVVALLVGVSLLAQGPLWRLHAGVHALHQGEGPGQPVVHACGHHGHHGHHADHDHGPSSGEGSAEESRDGNQDPGGPTDEDRPGNGCSTCVTLLAARCVGQPLDGESLSGMVRLTACAPEITEERAPAARCLRVEFARGPPARRS